MKKITAGVISLVFLFSMVVSSTTFSFAEDSVAEDQEQVDVVAEEVEPLEEEEVQPAPVITEEAVEEPLLLLEQAQELKLQPETRDAGANVVPDEVLRKAINQKLGLGDDNTADVTQAQVESLTGEFEYIGSPGNEIASIEGLQYAKNIEILTLPYANISDLTPLSELQSSKLYDLDLDSNQDIDDEEIAKLSQLSGLKELDIAKTNVSDLSVISDLDLTYLRADETKIGDDNLVAIANFKNMESLCLNGNGLYDVSPLANLPNIESIELKNNNISDPSPLANLPNVKDIELYNNNISDPSPLAKIKTLEILGLEHNKIQDLSCLSDFTQIIAIALTDNGISDITPLSELVNLREIEIGENNISDISSLSNLENLEWLRLEQNNISDISPLSNLDKLKGLYLNKNNISDVSVWKQLPSLRAFYCADQTVERAIGFPYTFNSMIIDMVGNVLVLEYPQNGIVNGDGTYGFEDGYSEATFKWYDVDANGNHTNFDGTLKVVKGWTLTSTANGHGTIDPVGNIAVESGTDKTFTFTPDLGYKVEKVIVDGEDKGALSSYNFINVTEDHTIEVTFEKEVTSHTITATAGANGSITPEGTVTVSHGSGQVFQIAPDAGYEVDKVVVDDVEQAVSDSYTFNNVTGDHKIEVTFKQITHTITATAGPHGTINPDGAVIVTHGSDQEFQITPEAGYKIKDVTVNGVSQGALEILLLQNIMGDQTVEATFEEDPVSVTSGGDQSMVEGSDTIEDIKLSGALEDFEGLWIDGTQLTQGTDYTTKSGSTIVTFASSYLKKLSKGTHNLEFHYTGDRVAKTTLTVTAKEENNGNGSGTTNNGSQGTSSGGSAGTVHGVNQKDGSADTGDHYPVAILLLAFLSMTVVVGLRKSQKN